jgi:hypothetical protein
MFELSKLGSILFAGDEVELKYEAGWRVPATSCLPGFAKSGR